MTGFAQSTDTAVLSERDFLQQVLEYAPKVEASRTKAAIQEQKWSEARAAFEPKFNSTYNSKNFEGTSYYDRLSTDLTVKTKLGVKVQAGYDRNSGTYLNPEGNLPEAGLVFAGLEVPLGAGLFTDKERTRLKQSRISADAAELVNQLEVNEYLVEAGRAYWNWYGSMEMFRLADEALTLAQDRLTFVKRMRTIGEAATIDTLEAFINYQNRLAFFIKSQIDVFKHASYLRNYIWDSTIDTNLVPMIDSTYEVQFPDSMITREMVRYHPMILLLDADSTIIQTDIALNREYFKPKLDVQFRVQETPGSVASFDYDVARNNYVGVKAHMPILLRKQRSKSRQLELEQDIIQNKRSDLTVKIVNNQRVALNSANQYKSSVDLWRDATINYKTMSEAEYTRYNLGESSLFVVNNRELRWIDARKKYIESVVRYRIEILQFYYSLGQLPDVVQ
ncbi:MAG: TolC family protein [Bacteroidia bacterium]|nr:TolC family protein [Bacteroidia bacterium]